MTAMFRSVLLLLFIKCCIGQGDKLCPTNCNCTDNSAMCNSTSYTSFKGPIFTIKISKPEEPITIDGQVFNVSGLEHLNSISIERASILTIDESALRPLPSLSTLSITNSTLPALGDPKVFSEAKNLRALQISNCALRKFELIKSESLEELDLSNNYISTITQNTFANVPFLTFVNLERNLISSVDSAAFSNLPNLQDVTMAHNNISQIPRDIFQNNTEIVSINLSHNPLTKIDLDLDADLEKLVLKSCQLRTFEESFAKTLVLLNHIDLSNNSLNLSSGFFDQMKELTFVDLSRNNLTNVDPYLFQFNNRLQKIILDYNHFRELSELQSRDDFRTDYFSCKHCGIVQIAKDVFKHFPFLVTLNLSHNKIGDANLAFLHPLRDLVKLDLSYNNLLRISAPTFANSVALQTVNLAGNFFKSIDSSIFQHNLYLKTLDISFCELRQLWQQPIKAKLHSLKQLKVANNSLTSISVGDLEVVPTLQELDLSYNPMYCDEVLHNTTAWLSKHNVEPMLDSPKWKTHEKLNYYEKLEKPDSSWKFLIKDRCLDEYYFDTFEDDEEEIGTFGDPNKDKSSLAGKKESNDDEDDYDDDDSFYRRLYSQTKRQSSSPFLEMVLIFIATAVTVLLLVVNIFLYCYRKKIVTGIVKIPHVKIPWINANNRHKHSGSVYQPLSEEKVETSSMINNEGISPHVPVLGV